MNTPVRVGLYTAGLFAVFGIAAAVGAAAGPIDVGGDESHTTHGTEAPQRPTTGLGLVANVSSTPAGVPFDYAFTVGGPDGPIADFAERHERRMHLIVVSDDLVDYWHLHPEMTADGTWHIEMPPLEARVYVVYADFQPVGSAQTTLQQRITVTASGAATSPRDLPVAAVATTVDGFDVTLSGTPAAAGESTLQFDVSRNGRPATTEPYLGAAGHLVAISTADHGYLHVHPIEGDGPEVRFAAELPAAGTYRLFFDFSVDGQVHTAAFTLDVPGAEDAVTVPGHDSAHEEHES